MEDVKIVSLFFARSEDAILETEKKYGSYLRQVAYRLLRSNEDTEEILEDAYLAAWNSIPPERPKKLQYYLARITRNLSMDRLDYHCAQCRDNRKKVLLSELEDCIPDSTGQSPWEAQEIGEALNRFLGKLPREDCALLLSRYFYGYTLGELVEKYQMPEHKIKYRLSKIRRQLAAFMQQEGIAL